ncbi:endonuclease/exonuclease/phosphatase family protein [Robiginitalea aurantiaca]|uniref:Endonuclease/exonuclease/phosphatase family protein n=1 Tax=Robiginitalea aurantiaca TaxID=3056915 RepID=A0ABT7WGW9_9FLAO|nr:endonuclease/exonuclease/phosphatase family protein [Robiginitalea aurantiaca]MDM9632064.1 endonuclease/exonuclease/phosphatase family protein [Robiginitalea aurantiaca]
MRALIKRFLFWVGVLLSGTLILACIHYFLPLPFFPILDAMSIAVPWLMLANLLYLLLTFPMKTRVFWWPFSALVISLLSFGSVYGFSLNRAEESEDSFTLISYNTRGFNARGYYEPRNAGDHIVAFLEDKDPDIICIQEFNRTYLPPFKRFAYRLVTPATSGKSPQAIFSKFPIINSDLILFPNSGNSAIFADILRGGDTLRIYNIHLQSYQIPSRSFLFANKGRSFFNRLNKVALKHREQAAIVRDHIKASPYPVILAGDLNATPFSRPYRVLSKGMSDSFRRRGNGWGATYYLNQMLPYRIDVVLVSEGIEVLDHTNFDIRYSDHLPIQVTLKPLEE